MAARSPRDYTIGWICAIEPELVAARGMLDERHDPAFFKPQEGDSNCYTFGRMGTHNIVIASLPSGTYGTTPCARVSTHLKRTFPWLRLVLLVGVGGGAPGPAHDIRLGDVVVSDPGQLSPGVIQYDMGKTVSGLERPQRTGVLNKPPEWVRTALASFRARHRLGQSLMHHHITKFLGDNPILSPEYAHQGNENDVLLRPRSKKRKLSSAVDEHEARQEVARAGRPTINPTIFYGTIASGNQVIKDCDTRDYWRDLENVLCFEMEAAGLIEDFPFLVIRGICDYSDSHKDKRWQPYAALTAVAFTKERLKEVLAPQMTRVNMSPEENSARLTNELAQDLRRLSTFSKDQVSAFGANYQHRDLDDELGWFTNTQHYYRAAHDSAMASLIRYQIRDHADLGPKLSTHYGRTGVACVYIHCLKRKLVPEGLQIAKLLATEGQESILVLWSFLSQILFQRPDTDINEPFITQQVSELAACLPSQRLDIPESHKMLCKAILRALVKTYNTPIVIVIDCIDFLPPLDCQTLSESLQRLLSQMGTICNLPCVITEASPSSSMQSLSIHEFTEFEECLRCLQFQNMYRRRDLVATAEIDTTHWLWAHPSYTDWYEARSAILWIDGKPGSGKSVLAKSIQKRLKQSLGESNSGQQDSFSEWYFSARDDLISHGQMFRALLYQILVQDPALFQQIRSFYRKGQWQKGVYGRYEYDWDTCHVKDALIHIAASSKMQRMFWTIDGLDESEVISFDPEASRRETLEFFRQLVLVHAHAKVIVLSRPAHDIEQSLRHEFRITVEDCNSKDVEQIVHVGLERLVCALERADANRVKSNPRRSEPERAGFKPRMIARRISENAPESTGSSQSATPYHDGFTSVSPGAKSDSQTAEYFLQGDQIASVELENIRHYLITHARGVILWVKTILQALPLQAKRPFCSYMDLRKELTRLPIDLMDLYEEITNNLHADPDNEEVLPLARRTLMWVTAATALRPLQLQELFDALQGTQFSAGTRKKPASLDTWVNIESWLDFQRHLSRICGPLVEIVRPAGLAHLGKLSQTGPTWNDEVQLLHQTVKDFLENSQKAKTFSISFDDAQSIVADECELYFSATAQISHGTVLQALRTSDGKDLTDYLESKRLLPFAHKMCHLQRRGFSYLRPTISFETEKNRQPNYWPPSAQSFEKRKHWETAQAMFNLVCNNGRVTAIENLLNLYRWNEGLMMRAALLAAITHKLVRQAVILAHSMGHQGLLFTSRQHYYAAHSSRLHRVTDLTKPSAADGPRPTANVSRRVLKSRRDKPDCSDFSVCAPLMHAAADSGSYTLATAVMGNSIIDGTDVLQDRPGLLEGMTPFDLSPTEAFEKQGVEECINTIIQYLNLPSFSTLRTPCGSDDPLVYPQDFCFETGSKNKLNARLLHDATSDSTESTLAAYDLSETLVE